MKAGFNGPIYCTPATAEVARIVLEDSAKIQWKTFEHLNRRSRGPRSLRSALYTPADLPAVIKLFKRVPYASASISAKASPSPSSMPGIFLDLLTLYSSGPRPARPQPAVHRRHRALQHADPPRSTVPAGRLSRSSPKAPTATPPTARSRKLSRNRSTPSTSILDRHSRLIVPSFAIGRTQTILWYLEKFLHEKKIPQIPIFIDSPMGVESTRIYSEFRENYDDQTNALIGSSDLFGLSHITLASSQRRQPKDQQPARPLRHHRLQPHLRIRPGAASPLNAASRTPTTWCSS